MIAIIVEPADWGRAQSYLARVDARRGRNWTPKTRTTLLVITHPTDGRRAIVVPETPHHADAVQSMQAVKAQSQGRTAPLDVWIASRVAVELTPDWFPDPLKARL